MWVWFIVDGGVLDDRGDTYIRYCHVADNIIPNDGCQ